MYLKRLEIQGFKTFAQKTVLEFMPDASGKRGVTVVVGPNGSGKSNIADAIRWVMGEQSLKLLRGKRSEDVIFSGSEKRTRSGFAEVTMTLASDGPGDAHPDLDLKEVEVTRRLYRDGHSEYEGNKQSARLTDVQLLLAQCGIGQRTYSVIGQGMIDHVLVASPTERKEFFDEAFGLRPFQLKKNQALNKIDDSKKNLVQSESLLREIEPRLKSLERQVNRLSQREALEEELQTLERAHYGYEWKRLSGRFNELTANVQNARSKEAALEKEASQLEADLVEMEKAVPVGEGFRELRQTLDGLVAKRASLREKQMKFETEQAIAEVRAEKPWAPLPLSKIIESVDTLRAKHETLDEILAAEKPDLSRLKPLAAELRSMSTELVGKLQRPAPEPEKAKQTDPKAAKQLAELTSELADITEQIAKTEAAMDAWNAREEGKRKHIFETQRKLSLKRAEGQAAERLASGAEVELARVETRRESFLQDIRLHAEALEKELDALAGTAKEPNIDASARIQKIRSQLEWIGGIDPETLKEHVETEERFEFLSKQIEDLRAGITALDTIVDELESTIRERSSIAFKKLDKEFSHFFKKLFDGGDAKLVEIAPTPEMDEEGNILEEVPEGAISGVEIQATPPGKRFKSIALLSGGERALTSIALICAIMATNPSPFVVLDEVDAALDETNSRKFAEIIVTLSTKTQFVVVTHNRATMTNANVLYGVTMGDDGVSKLLSVKMEEIENLRKNA